jgi:hypothetical protein
MDFSVSISQLHIRISDPDYDTFNWTIQGKYVTPSSQNGDTNGVKFATLKTPLPLKAEIIWYVNATDIHGKSTHKIYTFTTVHYAPINNNFADIDGNPDKGTEIDFTNVQETARDTNVMTIQEADYPEPDHKDAVDTDGSNVDGIADKGTETNFANAQGTTTDLSIMTLQESDYGIPVVDEYQYVSAFSGSYTSWEEEIGLSPYLNAIGGSSYIHEDKTGGAQDGWFDFTDTSQTGDGYTIVFDYYIYGDDTDDTVTLYYCNDGDSTYEGYIALTCTRTGSYGWLSTSSLTSQTLAQVKAMKVYLVYNAVNGGDDIYIDALRMHITKTATPNYNINQEFQWTTANFSDTTEKVCFYVTSHTGGTENLNVSYWDSTLSSWKKLGIISALGWNNLTATGLTSSTYTIRINGTIPTSDTTQDTWTIDCLLLHTYTSNQKIDFEYQWTNAPYNYTNKFVCMYVVGHTGSENLNINYWNGGSWTSLGSITTTGWLNVTATGLSSATYTIQLVGDTESGDSSQDSWTIDCLYLNSWND